jgi:hypothetical protein
VHRICFFLGTAPIQCFGVPLRDRVKTARAGKVAAWTQWLAKSGDATTVRFSFAFLKVGERNRDITTTDFRKGYNFSQSVTSAYAP